MVKLINEKLYRNINDVFVQIFMVFSGLLKGL